MAAAPGGVRQRTTHAHGVESPEPRAPSPRARQTEPRAPEHARLRQTLRKKIKTGRGHQGGLPGGGGVFWARGTPAWGREPRPGPSGHCASPGLCGRTPRPCRACSCRSPPPPAASHRTRPRRDHRRTGPARPRPAPGVQRTGCTQPAAAHVGGGGRPPALLLFRPTPDAPAFPGRNRVSPSPSDCPSPRPRSRCLVTCGS